MTRCSTQQLQRVVGALLAQTYAAAAAVAAAAVSFANCISNRCCYVGSQQRCDTMHNIAIV
eukprot:9240-Heterococcus_DN1.PRE.2